MASKKEMLLDELKWKTVFSIFMAGGPNNIFRSVKTLIDMLVLVHINFFVALFARSFCF